MLDDYSNELYRQMIINTLFVDGGGTFPWGKGTTNVKLILRPIYTPALRISFSDRYSIKIGCNLFTKFLVQPKEFEKTGTLFLKSLATKQSTLDADGFNIELREDFEEEEKN